VSSVSNPDGHSENIAPDPAHVADTLKQMRGHLLALATIGGMDVAHVHRLHDLDIAACAGLDDPQLTAYLSMLADTADRHGGRVPAGDTAPMHCEQCGPVWIHPTIAEVLPVVDGWPRALGCPWCFVRKAGGYIPRPSVTCEGCRHFTPDTINPQAGMGVCGVGNGMRWPMQRHACGNHSTRNPHEEA
ncbi:MAG TPA: hypothetical protein VMV99_10640, partial [Rhodanobacter sp.]|nr:hypothetical protein [Rhodanobacter sp.]